MTDDRLDGLLQSILGFGILIAILAMVAGALLSGPTPKEQKAAQAQAIVKDRADAYEQALADCHDLQKEHHLTGSLTECAHWRQAAILDEWAAEDALNAAEIEH
jgi:hypothetical protein